MLKSLEERRNGDEKHRFYEPMSKMSESVKNDEWNNEKYLAEVENTFKARAGDILDQIQLSHLKKSNAHESK